MNMKGDEPATAAEQGIHDLEWLFRPRSVAVIGSAKTGGDIVDVPHSFLFAISLRNMNFPGVYLCGKPFRSATSIT